LENSLRHCFLPALVSYTPKGQQDGVLLRTTWKVGGNEVVEIKSGGNRSDPSFGCVTRPQRSRIRNPKRDDPGVATGGTSATPAAVRAFVLVGIEGDVPASAEALLTVPHFRHNHGNDSYHQGYSTAWIL